MLPPSGRENRRSASAVSGGKGLDRRLVRSMSTTVEALNSLARPVQTRAWALATLMLHAPTLRAVAKRTMKVVGLGK